MRRNNIAVAVAIAAVAMVLSSQFAVATHSPANKVSVAASTLEEMEVQLVEGATSKPVTLLTGSIKTSSPTDLVFQLTSECALVTDTVNVGDSDSEAVATVKMWVEVDGKPVSVSPKSGDDGTIVFCNRAQRMVLSGFDEDDEDGEEQEKIEMYHSSRQANAFNWVRLNLGSGGHSIVVRGILEAEVTGTGKAQALVGRRTLVVEPTKLANDASF